MSEILRNEITENSVYLPEEKAAPFIHSSSTVRNSYITGNVVIDENVHIVNASVRADEGTPFYIGKGSNIQDFCILHGYSTRDNKTKTIENLVLVNNQYYSIYIGKYTTIAHGALIHGPAYIGDKTFIGFKSTVDAAIIGSNVEIGAHSYIKNVTIPDNISIIPNAVITKEEDIKNFIIESTGINNKIAKINIEMSKAYNKNSKCAKCTYYS